MFYTNFLNCFSHKSVVSHLNNNYGKKIVAFSVYLLC